MKAAWRSQMSRPDHMEDSPMAKCDVCGNDYDKAFTVLMEGSRHTFDSFECAIHALAPTCAHGGCKVIGHGVHKDATFFFCATSATHGVIPPLMHPPSRASPPPPMHPTHHPQLTA